MSIYVTDENGELYPLSGGSVPSENKSNISDDAAKYYENIYEAANKNLISHYYDDCIVTDVRQTIGVSTERQLATFRSDVLKPILQLIPISEIPSKVHYNVDMFEMIDGNAVEYDMGFFNLEKNTKYTMSFSTYINWADTTLFGVTIPVDDTSEHTVEFTTNSRGEYIFEHGFKMLPNEDYAMAVYQFEQICLVKGDYSGLSIQSGDVVTTVDVNVETYETFKRAKKYTDGVSKNKVDVVEGKSLSTNDYTNEDKNKLADINTQSIDFAESERQKSKNLFDYTRQSVVGDTINNQDGSFTIDTIFYYSNFNINVDLKPNTKYTFAETVQSVSDSVSIAESDVKFEVVVYYTDDTYTAPGGVHVRKPGRYSVTLTTTEKTIEKIEFRALRKNNNTSHLTGAISEISVNEGDDNDYQPYNGAIVHDKDLAPELLYDNETKQTIGGVVYPNGIGDGNAGTYTINNIDLTPYKYMYVYQRMYGEVQKIFVDLTKSVEAGGYCGGQSTLSYNIDALDCSLVKVPTTKDSITFDVRYIRLSDVSIQGTPVNVRRIEVYK